MIISSIIICSITVLNLIFNNLEMGVEENTCIKEGLEYIVGAVILLLK